MNDSTVNLEGRVALVTGAGNGIGREVAFTLASAGAAVCCVDLERDAVEAVAASIRQQGGRALALVADVAAEDDVERVHEDCTSALGTVQILVNNAGVQYLSPVEEFPIPEWDRLNGILLRGPFLYIRRFVPGMASQGWGRIVNVASVAGKEGNANACAYSAAKAGVIALTKSLGKELAQSGIIVNCVAPAMVQTDLLGEMTPEYIRTVTAKIPMGRFGTVEENAEMVAWLCSDACSFATGAVFDVSGGRATY